MFFWFFNQECTCWLGIVTFYTVYTCYVHKGNYFTLDIKIIVLGLTWLYVDPKLTWRKVALASKQTKLMWYDKANADNPYTNAQLWFLWFLLIWSPNHLYVIFRIIQSEWNFTCTHLFENWNILHGPILFYHLGDQ
jgi:hypothetical protein